MKGPRERESDSGPPGPEVDPPSKDYYYDDATGYEVYDPKDDEDEEVQNRDR